MKKDFFRLQLNNEKQQFTRSQLKTLLILLVTTLMIAGSIFYCDVTLGSKVFSLVISPAATFTTIALLIGLTLVFYTLTRRLCLSAALVFDISVLLSGISRIKYKARLEALLPDDFLIATTFNNGFAEKYIDYSILIISIIFIIFFTAIGIVSEILIKRFAEDSTKKISIKENVLKRLSALIIGAILIFTSYLVLFYDLTGVHASTFNSKNSEKKFGIYLHLMRMVAYGDYHTSYDNETIEAVVKKYQAQAETENRLRTDPDAYNIIYVLDESFTDPRTIPEYIDNVIGGYDFDYSFYDELYEKYPSGWLISPTFGGGTADVEFEVLTGLSNYFCDRTNPYTSLVATRKELDSVPRYYHDLGYNTSAIHPNSPTFYRRDKAFATLGFDKFYADEYFVDLPHENYVNHGNFFTDFLPGYATDKAVFDLLLNSVLSTEGKDFVHTITIQNHTPYISPTEYYSRLEMTLDAIKYLEQEINTMDEKTLVVIYGDHHPDNQFIVNPVNDLRSYTTPVFIMANFELPDTEIGIISPNQLSNTVFNMFNWKKPAIYYLLDDLAKEAPVLTVKNSEFAGINSSEYDGIIREYDIYEYAMLFGD
jgi:phosphoglycerol transferase MdoB-like AlkP superfamily enzyme